MALFQKRKWEGNVRGLENLIIQGILFSSQDTIQPFDLSSYTEQNHSLIWDSGLDGLPYKRAKEKT